MKRIVSRKMLLDNDTKLFPVIGIGASAGGLSAFESFFSGFSDDANPGMAFVLIQHLSPDHDSLLSNLVRQYTKMAVIDVVNGCEIQVNTVYVIPPKCDLSLVSGKLLLSEPAAPHGHRFPIDFFFTSLAHDQLKRAICIVLSGTGSDGTAGLREVKKAGGLGIAQTLSTCEFAGMPQSVISSELVDLVLDPSEMGGKLAVYIANEYQLPENLVAPMNKPGTVLRKILDLIASETGNDLTLYKANTIYRRIERRMAKHSIASADAYFQYLKKSPEEIDVLLSDLLIGVTRFFRDSNVFKKMEEEILPEMFSGSAIRGRVVRLWCAGCSTGEEAYSLAILVMEYMELKNETYTVQIFATDINKSAIQLARAGCYSADIVNDLTPERLKRYFTHDTQSNRYTVQKKIRDMLIFSTQNVISDPPFSRLSMISCRNLMIYMSALLQKRLIPLFHYALNPGGVLFLGTSESIGDFGELFVPLDIKFKFYKRRQEQGKVQDVLYNQLTDTFHTRSLHMADLGGKPLVPGKNTLLELVERSLLKQIAPSSALVNRRGDILYLYGRMGKYLEPASGVTGINNILTMAGGILRQDLTTLLRKSLKENTKVQETKFSKTDTGITMLSTITISPVIYGELTDTVYPAFLITITEHVIPLSLMSNRDADIPSVPDETQFVHKDDAGIMIAALGDELRTTRDYYQAINEELVLSNSILQSSNEELHSTNEELQSTNEELETSKEEMQSVNEEISTMNAEFQRKNTELSHAGNDMNNLLASTGIGTVFIDLKFCISRFTPDITKIINLIPGDIGRPIAHIVTNLAEYSRLVTDVKTVLDTLTPIEADVETKDHHWYTMRIRPYRTLENTIEGVVVAFIDITENIKIRKQLEKANEIFRLASFPDTESDSNKEQQIIGVVNE